MVLTSLILFLFKGMTQQNRDILLHLLAEHSRLGISEQIDYEKFYLYSVITHSTAIEGSTVTELENLLLFDEGITAKGRSLMEQMMNLDLKAAYEYGLPWIKTHEDVTPESLRTLSAKVMEHTGNEYHTIMGDFSAAKGDFRLLNVTAGFAGKSYMAFQKVPAKLQAFCDELNVRRKAVDPTDAIAIYELSFWAHYELVTIHPWADGNGRTCRLLMNLLQMEFGVLPTKVMKEDKAKYIQALIDTRETEDLEIFLNCMTELHFEQLKRDIEAFTASIELDAIQKGGQKKQDEQIKGGQKASKVDRKGGQKTKEFIIELIRKNPQISTTAIASALGINRSAVSKHMKQMQEQMLIRRVGPDKGGHWEVL